MVSIQERVIVARVRYLLDKTIIEKKNSYQQNINEIAQVSKTFDPYPIFQTKDLDATPLHCVTATYQLPNL